LSYSKIRATIRIALRITAISIIVPFLMAFYIFRAVLNSKCNSVALQPGGTFTFFACHESWQVSYTNTMLAGRTSLFLSLFVVQNLGVFHCVRFAKHTMKLISKCSVLFNPFTPITTV
jgi:hypothetical protein